MITDPDCHGYRKLLCINGSYDGEILRAKTEREMIRKVKKLIPNLKKIRKNVYTDNFS